MHAYKAQVRTAREYRLPHGLQLSKGLVTGDLHERMAEDSKDRPNPALVAARDPAKATAAGWRTAAPSPRPGT